MRTFLLNKSAPILKWGLLPQNVRYQGEIPDGYDLAINPHYPYIIVDVDRHGKDGFLAIPEHLKGELDSTLHYPTKRNGKHYWFYYSGDKQLANKASGLGIDLRVWSTDTNNGGYVKWHPRNEYKIEDVLWKAKETSIEMNKWLETLFSYK
jgi:hypothetical protein